MDIVGRVGRLMEQHKPDAVFIDGTGIGAGISDRLKELYRRGVFMVTFGARASKTDRYANKRAEMW